MSLHKTWRERRRRGSILDTQASLDVACKTIPYIIYITQRAQDEYLQMTGWHWSLPSRVLSLDLQSQKLRWKDYVFPFMWFRQWMAAWYPWSKQADPLTGSAGELWQLVLHISGSYALCLCILVLYVSLCAWKSEWDKRLDLSWSHERYLVAFAHEGCGQCMVLCGSLNDAEKRGRYWQGLATWWDTGDVHRSHPCKLFAEGQSSHPQGWAHSQTIRAFYSDPWRVCQSTVRFQSRGPEWGCLVSDVLHTLFPLLPHSPHWWLWWERLASYLHVM